MCCSKREEGGGGCSLVSQEGETERGRIGGKGGEKGAGREKKNKALGENSRSYNSPSLFFAVKCGKLLFFLERYLLLCSKRGNFLRFCRHFGCLRNPSNQSKRWEHFLAFAERGKEDSFGDIVLSLCFSPLRTAVNTESLFLGCSLRSSISKLPI